MISILPHDPDTTRDLQAFIVTASIDEDSEDIHYLYEWEVDGQIRDGQTDSILPASETLKGENWVLKVRASDGENISSTAFAMTYVINSPPTAALSLSPVSPLASEDITAELSLSDADGDDLTALYTWSVDGKISAYDDAVLPAGATLRGEVWSLTVVPSDGEDDGQPVTVEVSIENAPPEIVSLSIDPDPATAASPLLASVEASDADGDEIGLHYTWSVDGTAVQDGDDAALPADLFDKGQTVAVVVTPSDDFIEGESWTQEIAINNSLPVVSAVQISPSDPTISDTLSCSYSFSDADGDPDSSEMSWTVNESPVSSPEGLVSGDSITCTITPHDGEEFGEPQSDTVRIDNALPEMLTATLSPEEVGTDDMLTASATAIDPEGDTVSFSYTWYVEGLPLPETTDSLDGATWFDKGDEVYVEITPVDPTGSGAPLSSDSIIVGNTPPDAPSVEIDPASPVEGAEPLLCEVEVTDPDDDPLSYLFTWTVDGVSFTDTESTTWTDDTVPSEQPLEGEIWTCSAIADDGEDYSAAGEASVEVMGPDVVTDFSLEDVNKTSASYGDSISPRDLLEQVSGWYFGHST
jgi:hypothetical protein